MFRFETLTHKNDIAEYHICWYNHKRENSGISVFLEDKFSEEDVIKQMRKSERQEQILEMLKKDGHLKVSCLAQQFETSEITIRKDLNEMYEKGKIHRIYGGASLVTAFEEPLQERRKKNSENKRKIGELAATMIHNGDSIFIDGGTTIECLAKSMSHLSNITVITTGLNNVSVLHQEDGITIYVPEGRIDRTSYSIVGSLAESALKKYNARIAFVGSDSFTIEQGFLNNSYEASAISKILIEQSQITAILIDSSKFGNISSIKLCDISCVDYVITDSGIPKKYADFLESSGVRVLIAE